jgi:hypothetical protein
MKDIFRAVFRISQWLIYDVNSVLAFLRSVVEDGIADVSEMHEGFFFRIEMSIILYAASYCTFHLVSINYSLICNTLFYKIY